MRRCDHPDSPIFGGTVVWTWSKFPMIRRATVCFLFNEQAVLGNKEPGDAPHFIFDGAVQAIEGWSVDDGLPFEV